MNIVQGYKRLKKDLVPALEELLKKNQINAYHIVSYYKQQSETGAQWTDTQVRMHSNFPSS